MKYCPHCGAEYLVGTVSLCPVCGKSLPNPEASAEKKQKSKRWRKKNKTDEHSENKIMPECQDDPKDTGYDGYYDDVMPPDWDQVKEGVDKDLVRNIIALISCVALIMLMCVALLYVL